MHISLSAGLALIASLSFVAGCSGDFSQDPFTQICALASFAVIVRLIGRRLRWPNHGGAVSRDE